MVGALMALQRENSQRQHKQNNDCGRRLFPTTPRASRIRSTEFGTNAKIPKQIVDPQLAGIITA
jgi:hypothetical protein